MNWAAEYIMDHPEEFPEWRRQVQNILTLHLNRTSANPDSEAAIHSGAWAYPESSGCCGDSLSYTPQRLASSYLRLGSLSGDPWAREMGRRQILISTYDALDTGVVIDGFYSHKPVVAKRWFKIVTAVSLKFVLDAMAWYPEALAPNRENHLLRSTSTVKSISYGDGNIAYQTFAAPENSISVLRLAFTPESVMANGKRLKTRSDLKENGYSIQNLPDGDVILTVRHDGKPDVLIEGADPQNTVDDGKLKFIGEWSRGVSKSAFGGSVAGSSSSSATMSFEFAGNQVRLIGSAMPGGGQADVFIDERDSQPASTAGVPKVKTSKFCFREVVWGRAGILSTWL